MNRKPKKRKSQRPAALIACYNLREVKSLIKEERFLVTDNAVVSANDDFGGDVGDIKKFFLSLRKGHFYKREYAEKWDTDYLDVYKAEMYGQKVYTHFFIRDDGMLVIINSFKKDSSGAKS